MAFSSQGCEEAPWPHAQGPLCCSFGLEVPLGPLLKDLETEMERDLRRTLKRWDSDYDKRRRRSVLSNLLCSLALPPWPPIL